MNPVCRMFPSHVTKTGQYAANEVSYYEKRKHDVVVKAAECFPRDWIASSATELLCKLGEVIKATVEGVLK